MTIRVWSGDDGTHLHTLLGHANGVCALTVGLDDKVYSGSGDNTIRVWSATDGTHLHTLKGLEGSVLALAVMRDGTLVSGRRYYVENEGEDSDDEDEYVECAELRMW
jgi:WD40 repeat protein